MVARVNTLWIFRTGNPSLENAHLQSWEMTYDYSTRKLSLQANLFYEYTRNSLFDSFRQGENCILLEPKCGERHTSRR